MGEKPMTDPMELVRRLETYADPHEEIGMTYVRAALTEAAACIREMVEWRPMFEAPKDRTPILARIYDDLFPRVVGEARDDLERWNGQRVVVHHPGLCEDGYDLGWSVSAPVGFGIGRDDWFSGWLPLPPAPGAEA